MTYNNRQRGATFTAIQIAIAVILLVIIILLLVGYSGRQATVVQPVQNQPVQQYPIDQYQGMQQPMQDTIVMDQPLEEQEVQWVTTPIKKSSKKKVPVKKVVPKKAPKKITPKKVATKPTPIQPKVTTSDTQPIPPVVAQTPASTTNIQTTHVSEDGQTTETSVEADCTSVLIIRSPRPLQNVGGPGDVVNVSGALKNCNWIPTKMPLLYAQIVDSRNIFLSQRKQLYLPGSLTTNVFQFSANIPIIGTPFTNVYPGYAVFTGIDSLGNAIREVRVPITFR